MFWLDDADSLDVAQWNIHTELDFSLTNRCIGCNDGRPHRIKAIEIDRAGTRCRCMCAVDAIREVAKRVRFPGRVC